MSGLLIVLFVAGVIGWAAHTDRLKRSAVDTPCRDWEETGEND